MHIDDLREACEIEWRDTVELGVKFAMGHLSENDVDPDYDKAEVGADYAIERIFECVDYQDAVAYIVASGFTFDCLENTWDNLRTDSPKRVMWREIRDRLIDELGDAR